MYDIASQINDLIARGGKSAATMTKILKRIGGNSMQKGIARIVEHATKDGFRKGIKIGTIAGSAIGLLSWFILDEIKAHRLHEEEGKALLKELEDAIADESKNNSCTKLPSDATGDDKQNDELETLISNEED